VSGNRAWTKALTPAMLTLPLRQQDAFLRAWASGDGHQFSAGWKISTASQSLAVQGQQILLRLGKIASYGMQPRRYPIKIQGREIKNPKPLYSLIMSDKPHLTTLTGEDFILVPLHQTTPERGARLVPYTGEVCDLQTESQNFVTASGVVHNCAIYMPPEGVKPFTWPARVLQDIPSWLAEAPQAFQNWFDAELPPRELWMLTGGTP